MTRLGLLLRNLRHFRVRYVAVPDLASALAEDLGKADGLILVALCETAQERDDAIKFARSGALTTRTDVLMAVPVEVSERDGRGAYVVTRDGDRAVEERLEPRRLANP